MNFIESEKTECCIICKKPTNKVEVYSESYLCSDECCGALYKIVSEQEQCASTELDDYINWEV